MLKKELATRLKAVGCSFHLSSMKYSLTPGALPMYHIDDEEMHQMWHFESVAEIREFLWVRKAAKQATSPEAALEIMKAGGY